MLRSLYSGISGLRAHQTMLDVTGNNIANVNTAGFKGSSTQFQDTLSQLTQAAAGPQP
ncbi:MAG TPA: flagellar basal body protein, partial [Intrasporangium sp.]|nr:flagellar basal body protein [Intrasporangium sp.]